MFSYLQISKITCLTHLFLIVSLSKAKKIHGLWSLILRGQCNFIRDFYGFSRQEEENWDATPQWMLGSRSYPRIRVEYKLPCILICIHVHLSRFTHGLQAPKFGLFRVYIGVHTISVPKSSALGINKGQKAIYWNTSFLRSVTR